MCPALPYLALPAPLLSWRTDFAPHGRVGHRQLWLMPGCSILWCIAHGGDVSSRGSRSQLTPLAAAVSAGQELAVELLQLNGASPAPNESSASPAPAAAAMAVQETTAGLRGSLTAEALVVETASTQTCDADSLTPAVPAAAGETANRVSDGVSEDDLELARILEQRAAAVGVSI